MNRTKTLLLLMVLALPATSRADEWSLRWGIDLPARKPAWQHTQRMGMDTGYSVAGAGGLVFVGCEHNGALLALEGKSGEQRWRFFTTAPIRQVPVANQSHVYFGSDDGYLYCLDHAGKLAWKIRGGPSERLVIGHDRIMSAWPISAKPLLHEGVLYFVAGYWPVDGIYVHAVDAASGKPRWVNGDAEFRPTREITLVDGKLMVDGDNSSAVLDAKTGTLLKEKPVKPQPHHGRASVV
jgi:outer membrane protein assembly factor BamB